MYGDKIRVSQRLKGCQILEKNMYEAVLRAHRHDISIWVFSIAAFQIDIPVVSHTTNDTSFFGCTLNSTLKTSQKIKILAIGLMNVQMKPRNDPTYWVITSLLASNNIRFF
jgi:hypothetical protein